MAEKSSRFEKASRRRIRVKLGITRLAKRPSKVHASNSDKKTKGIIMFLLSIIRVLSSLFAIKIPTSASADEIQIKSRGMEKKSQLADRCALLFKRTAIRGKNVAIVVLFFHRRA